MKKIIIAWAKILDRLNATSYLFFSFIIFLIISFMNKDSSKRLEKVNQAIDPFRIRRATSVPLGKGTKIALHHGKMSTTKRRAIQFLHISTFQFTFKCGYNYFVSKYRDINSLNVTQIDLLHTDTFCST